MDNLENELRELIKRKKQQVKSPQPIASRNQLTKHGSTGNNKRMPKQTTRNPDILIRQQVQTLKEQQQLILDMQDEMNRLQQSNIRLRNQLKSLKRNEGYETPKSQQAKKLSLPTAQSTRFSPEKEVAVSSPKIEVRWDGMPRTRNIMNCHEKYMQKLRFVPRYDM